MFTEGLPHLGARAVCAGPVLRHADACGKMCRVGQNHIYIRCFQQGNHQIYGHIQCIYIYIYGSIQP